MVQLLWRTVWQFLKKVELPYEPAILDIFPKALKAETQTDTYPPIFIVLFIIAKGRNQVSIMWYIHIMEFYSALKRVENMT